jgi:hypothetical protein
MGFKVITNENETKVFFNDIDISNYVMQNMEILNNGTVASRIDGKLTQLLTLRMEVDLEELNGMKTASISRSD